MSTKTYRNKGKAKTLLNLLPEPAVVVDAKGNFVNVNDAFEEITGLSREELVRVLHVDDDSGLLTIMKESLEMECHFEVHNASSVEEAVKKVSQETYDAIVSDYQIPDKDGHKVSGEFSDNDVRDNSGNPTGFVVVTRKVIESKKNSRLEGIYSEPTTS